MAVNASISWSHLSQQEKEIRGLLRGNKTQNLEHLNRQLALFRLGCQLLMLQDFEKAHQKNVENRLWEIHGLINGCHRKQLKQYNSNDGKKKRVEKRKAQNFYLQFVKSGQCFYRSFLQALHSHFGGIPLQAIAQIPALSLPSSGENVRISDELQSLLMKTCHQTLIQLGDLSRWRETQLKSQNKNWEPAKGYYDLASRINPSSGASNNQLAVMALQDKNHLESVYLLYLTLVAEEPFPSAEGNLKTGFRKIEARLSETEVPQVAQSAVENLVVLFVRLHVYFFKACDLPDLDELENDTLKEMEINMKNLSTDTTLSKMVLINIAAVYFAEQRLHVDPESPEVQRSHCLLQRMNVKTFSTLLSFLRSELEQLDDKGPSTFMDTQKQERLSIPTAARRVLPALRLYSSRMMVDARTLFGVENDIGRDHCIKEMWKVYADVLTRLAFLFPVNETIEVEYLLDEDERTLGLSLFKHENINHRYRTKDGISQKPRKYDSKNRPYKIETSTRVHDLLADAFTMQEMIDIPVIPTDSGKAFRFLEDVEYCQEMNAPRDEITRISETIFPHPLSVTGQAPVLMDIDLNPTVNAPENEEQQRDNRLNVQRTELTKEPIIEETSYRLLGSATVLEHFAMQPATAAPQGSANLPMLQHQPKSIRVSLDSSTMPTPTFEESCLESVSLTKAKEHPNVRAKQIQKALDESKFMSSNFFPKSTGGPGED